MKKTYTLSPTQLDDANRLKSIFESKKRELNLSQLKLGTEYDLGSQGMVWQYLNGKAPLNLEAATKFARALRVPISEFSPSIALSIERANKANLKQTRSASQTNYTVGIADDFSDDWEEIPYYYAKGACGNGSDNHTDEIRGTLRKEKSWFIRFGVKPENLFTVYAEGDSNADFILDGDMVIFDRSKITPKDGSMFFIKHPAGDRIKTLRRKANGNWLLCSRNHDKTRFPDEEITAEEAQLIEILGEYVYRQG